MLDRAMHVQFPRPPALGFHFGNALQGTFERRNGVLLADSDAPREALKLWPSFDDKFVRTRRQSYFRGSGADEMVVPINLAWRPNRFLL